MDGGLDNNETFEECAVRELKEELSINVSKEQLKFLEINEHYLEYENGDKARYFAHIYVLELEEFPYIKLDSESGGIISISRDNFDNFTNAENEDSLQIHKCWASTLNRVFEEYEI